jgi:catechol 2,3-dioxygenase-like lactoylglutathione lyase family enzyme
MDADHDPAGVERVDHVAIVVPDFDATVAMLTASLGLRCARIGRLGKDGTRRIAMIADGTGFKLEIIEAAEGPDAVTGPTLDHVALRVRDVDESHRLLLDAGFVEERPPRRLEPAHARTALLAEPNGMQVQVIRYDPTSPDL